MFKLLLIACVVVAANAGVIGLGGHGVAVAVAHGAESYQNNNLLAVHPVPVVAQVKAIAAAPIAVAHAPIAVGIGHGGLGLGLGGLGGLGGLH